MQFGKSELSGLLTSGRRKKEGSEREKEREGEMVLTFPVTVSPSR